jgi:hypothetical protein
VSITANLAPDYSLGQALDFLDATAAKLLKPGYTTDLNGTSREFRNSQGALGIVFVLALLFIFLVLAAQFESFVDPLVIMLSVPLSMIGALLALKWSGGSLNVYSQIGLITLVGLITKHGILIVEFTNQLREHGMDMTAAVVKGASQRLRPILMTTGAMVLGAMPLALAHRRRVREPAADRLGDRGGHVAGHLADHLRRPDDLHPAGAQSGARADHGRSQGWSAGRAWNGRRGDDPPRSSRWRRHSVGVTLQHVFAGRFAQHRVCRSCPRCLFTG